MSNSDILVSFVYVVYITAPAIREELWLRVSLFIASVGFAIWGVMLGSWPVIGANILFCLLSLRQIRRAYDDRRPVDLAEDAAQFGAEMFPEMQDQDLDRFWRLGESMTYETAAITTVGEVTPHLFAVLEGEIEVELADGSTVMRSAPAIIGEISLAGQSGNATATVIVHNARVHSWRKTDLDVLQDSHPSFTGPFVKGLSAQMASRFVL